MGNADLRQWGGRAAHYTVVCLALGISMPPPAAGLVQGLPAISEYTRGMPHVPGAIPLYFEEETGRVFLELDPDGDPILHMVGLSTGFGWPLDAFTIRSDRATTLLRFQRRASEVQLSAEHAPYPGSADDAGPHAVPAALPVVAEDGARVLVDGTAFLVRDADDVIGSLEMVGESAEFDRDRSGVEWPPPTQSATSTSLDVRTVFGVPGGSAWVERRSPDPERLTVVQRHIFLEAPADFNPLPAVPGSPVDSRFVEEWLPRWRIGSARVGSPGSPSPLRVFLDHRIPEEHRGAITEGLAYWNLVLRAAGVPDTIEILDLPPAVDPLDPDVPVVVLWTTRRQPMSSAASYASDPRTGELLKGIIHLDSHWPLVARNEYRAYRSALLPGAPDEAEYVSARVRWAVAHEMGHVLAGLSHPGLRRSAVGFRPPGLTVASGGARLQLDLRSVLPDEPFPYDVWAVRHAYHTWPDPLLDHLREDVSRGAERGLRFTAYFDGLLFPEAVGRLPDGQDPPGALRSALEVRSVLLSKFGPGNIDPGEADARLIERLFPAYLHHRFAVEAVGRMVGGLRFSSPAGEVEPLPARDQWLALDLLVDALRPEVLRIPEHISRSMPAMPTRLEGFDVRAETEPAIFRFQPANTRPVNVTIQPGGPFDPVPWAEALADLTLATTLIPARMSRLEAQVRDDPSLPSLESVVRHLISEVWWSPPADDAGDRELQRVAKRTVLDRLIVLASNDGVSPAARTTIRGQLTILGERLASDIPPDPADAALVQASIRAIEQLKP